LFVHIAGDDVGQAIIIHVADSHAECILGSFAKGRCRCGPVEQTHTIIEVDGILFAVVAHHDIQIAIRVEVSNRYGIRPICTRTKGPADGEACGAIIEVDEILLSLVAYDDIKHTVSIEVAHCDTTSPIILRSKG